MAKYIVYNSSGKILRVGVCPKESVKAQAKENEFVMVGEAGDKKHKIVDGEVEDKTPLEIEADKPTPVVIPEREQIMIITKGVWEDMLVRLGKLENP